MDLQVFTHIREPAQIHTGYMKMRKKRKGQAPFQGLYGHLKPCLVLLCVLLFFLNHGPSIRGIHG